MGVVALMRPADEDDLILGAHCSGLMTPLHQSQQIRLCPPPHPTPPPLLCWGAVLLVLSQHGSILDTSNKTHFSKFLSNWMPAIIRWWWWWWGGLMNTPGDSPRRRGGARMTWGLSFMCDGELLVGPATPTASIKIPA